ncbi:MAG TPA: hypothetical protein VEX57_05110 [Microlunatus sp.]|nr:hypothetical protein [Microlunatus sp.]
MNNETVAILYGSADGVRAAGHQLWSQDSPGIAGSTSEGVSFGASMVAGHFAGSPYADLTIGVPGYTVGSEAGAEAVAVIYGSASGLSVAGNQLWTQNGRGIAGKAERHDAFGSMLAAGQLNGKAFDALAVGVPARGSAASGARER